jgi:hypothetical protein
MYYWSTFCTDNHTSFLMNVAVKLVATLLRIKEILDQVSVRIPAILTQDFCGCPQYLQQKPIIVAD